MILIPADNKVKKWTVFLSVHDSGPKTKLCKYETAFLTKCFKGSFNGKLYTAILLYLIIMWYQCCTCDIQSYL